ncbi:MAG: ABC transporter permease subunit, partial [Bdellovibrio sp.]|nr:ABC transporter permease subunit [Bdellovibrio sp.]
MKPSQDILANIKRRQMWDFVFAMVGLLSLLFALVTLLTLIVDLSLTGVPRINAAFFTSFPSRFPEKAGILSAWVGSFCIMLTTAFCAIPLGVAAGVYLEEYSKKNWVSQIIELNIINLAGIPSITYGLMALGLFVYKLKLGQSILTAGLTLGLLVLPIIIVTTREAIRSIPNTIREASYAM